LVNVFEYAAQLNTIARTVLFYLFLTTCLGIFYYYILIPVFKLFSIGKTISDEEASLLIGKHFTDVQDKLINTLQLNKQFVGASGSLIAASIDQKIGELSPVPFKKAIDFKKNIKYARFTIIPVLVAIVILFTNSSILTESTKRLINYKVPYEKMAPRSEERRVGKSVNLAGERNTKKQK